MNDIMLAIKLIHIGEIILAFLLSLFVIFSGITITLLLLFIGIDKENKNGN